MGKKKACARVSSVGNAEAESASAHITVLPGMLFCEPVIWCRWTYRGDLTACNAAASMELMFNDFSHLMKRYPKLRCLGTGHGDALVSDLNDAQASDLYNSGTVYENSRKGLGGRMGTGLLV